MKTASLRLALILGPLLSWVLLTQVLAPWWLKRAFQRFATESCKSCSLTIESLRMELLSPGTLHFSNVHLLQGERGASDVEARIPEGVLEVLLWPLLERELRIRRLRVAGADVIYTDGEAPKPKEESLDEEVKDDSAWAYRIEGAGVRGAHFTYRRVLHGEASLLQLHNIHVEVDEFGSTDNLRARPLKFHSNFRLEKSGRIKLALELPLAQDELFVDLNLQIEDQNLADLNVFFESNDGVVLKGRMLDADGRVAVRGDKLTARVRAVYEGFSATMLKNEEQGRVESFLTNVGIKLVTKPDNTKRSVKDQTDKVTLKRAPNQSAVHFILTGLKNAALEVARN